ncbi:YkvA family protein [Neobacillus terrae]|uniref:YkvA family protein n=1 Tax=Neobacillus terrae TaxID=3034837 RepID=UPI003082EF6B
MILFGFKKDRIEKEQQKYELKAKDYINNPKKTQGLLKSAVKKANDKKGTLGETWDKLQLFFDLIKAWTKGDYRDISKGTIMTVIGAVIYFVSPIDIIPDFLVGFGIFDDAAVIGFTLKKISGDLEKFREWRDSSSPLINAQNPLE